MKIESSVIRWFVTECAEFIFSIHITSARRVSCRETKSLTAVVAVRNEFSKVFATNVKDDLKPISYIMRDGSLAQLLFRRKGLNLTRVVSSLNLILFIIEQYLLTMASDDCCSNARISLSAVTSKFLFFDEDDLVVQGCNLLRKSWDGH